MPHCSKYGGICTVFRKYMVFRMIYGQSFRRKMIIKDEITTQNLVVGPWLYLPPPTYYVSIKILWDKHGEMIT